MGELVFISAFVFIAWSLLAFGAGFGLGYASGEARKEKRHG